MRRSSRGKSVATQFGNLETGDVVPKVGGEVRRVRHELLEVVTGCVVESEARGLAELGIEPLQLPFEPSLSLEDLCLGRSSQAGERVLGTNWVRAKRLAGHRKVADFGD